MALSKFIIFSFLVYSILFWGYSIHLGLDALCSQSLGVCVDLNGRRTCPHFFHLQCLERVEGAHCPQCRCRFFRRCPLPRLTERGWWRLVAPTNLQRDLLKGLRACVKLPSEELEALLADFPNVDGIVKPEAHEEVMKSVQGSCLQSLFNSFQLFSALFESFRVFFQVL